MEDGDTAELAAVPLGLVFGELGVDGLQEWAHEGNLVGGTNDRTLVVVVFDCDNR